MKRIFLLWALPLFVCANGVAQEYNLYVTPKSMRMRKVILDELERKRANKE